MQLASMRVFRAKIPAVVDTDTLEPLSRMTMTPETQETTAEQSAESKQPPLAAEQPTTLAKVEPQQVKKPQITPPRIKPAIPKKNGANNTIYRESWLLDQDSSFYTLQVLGVRNEESLLDFIQRYKLLQKKNVAYYKTVYRGKQWYPLLYGVYPTKSDAAAAVKELPDKVQKSIPWIRKMSAVQNEVRVAAKK
jgi:DamX protein